MKTKVLFLLHLPPPVHGSSMVGQFIKESKLINSNIDATYLNLLASKNVGNTGKISLGKIWGFVITWFQLLRYLFFNKPKLCYFALTATGAAFLRDVFLVLLLKLFRVRIVYHMHNKGISRYNESRLYSKLYKFIFNNTQVILLSKYLYYDIEKYVSKSNIHICPNGIPMLKNLSQSKPNDKVKLLFLSNLILSKGVYVLLEACKILKQKNIDFECNYIGGEADITKQKLENKIKEYKLEENVFYLGKKYGEEKHHYFNEADIFVFPTYYPNECFPLVLLEAMQHKLPVITTSEGGIASLVKENETGFLIPQKNHQKLAIKLQELIESPDLRNKMSKKGYDKFTNEFTLKKFEKNLLDILNKLSK